MCIVQEEELATVMFVALANTWSELPEVTHGRRSSKAPPPVPLSMVGTEYVKYLCLQTTAKHWKYFLTARVSACGY